MFYGLLDLSFWQYVIVFFILTHITFIAITLYLHRCQAHRAIELHPIFSHFCRFWLWLTTGMVTDEWVAVHRKHHAYSDKRGDPHSPKVFGIKTVFFQGAELYRSAAKDKDMVKKFSQGTPNDWLERNVYRRFPYLGIGILFIIDIVLLGIPGITFWALQMMWTPLCAAGIVNGIGHYWGYRNYECSDAARNIIPLGILLAGEELHNNHHTYGTSAKFSLKWWELDIGWQYIKFLTLCRLAKIRRVAPKLQLIANKSTIDLETLKTIINNRFQVITHYGKEVMLPMLASEKLKASVASQKLLKRGRKLLLRDNSLIDSKGILYLTELLAQRENLRKAYDFRQRLQAIWQQTSATQYELIAALQEWCKQAEASGIEALQQFAIRLKGYSVALT